MKMWKLLGMCAIPFLILMGIICYLLAWKYYGFNLVNNTISDLGCKSVTKYYQLFNIGLIISGILLGCLFYGISLNLIRKFPNQPSVILSSIICVLFLTGWVGLICVGIFPGDGCLICHGTSAIITFVSLGIGEVLVGILHLINKHLRPESLIILPAFAVVAILFIYFSSKGKYPIFEWLFIILVIIWSYPLLADFYIEALNIV